MPDCALTEMSKKPTTAMVAEVLGATAGVWSDFLAFLDENHSPIASEWKFGKTGWMLISKREARTVCYLFPEQNQFTVAFVLGGKAVEMARASKLPKKILEAMEAAKPYAEGRGFYVKAAKPADLKHLQTLVTIKMQN
jgi:hypothetical protein